LAGEIKKLHFSNPASDLFRDYNKKKLSGLHADMTMSVLHKINRNKIAKHLNRLDMVIRL